MVITSQRLCYASGLQNHAYFFYNARATTARVGTSLGYFDFVMDQT